MSKYFVGFIVLLSLFLISCHGDNYIKASEIKGSWSAIYKDKRDSAYLEIIFVNKKKSLFDKEDWKYLLLNETVFLL